MDDAFDGAGSPLVRHMPIQKLSDGGIAQGAWSELSRSEVAPGEGRLLAWDCCAYPPGGVPNAAYGYIALGFEGGAVALLMVTGIEEEEGALFSIVDQFQTPGEYHAHDIAAVKFYQGPCAADRAVSDPRAAAGSGDRASSICVLAGDAGGCVCLWGLSATPCGTGFLVALQTLLIGIRQPCTLGLVHDMVICGCTDGTIVAQPYCPSTPPEQSSWDVPQSRREMLTGAASSISNYIWRIDTGAGEQGRGLLSDKRRAFDGWAKTVAYETGLRGVLERMDQLSGFAAETGRPTSLKHGARVKLSGLDNAHFNGAAGVCLGGLDAESGRVPVQLLAPPQHKGRRLKVKLHHLLRQHERH